MQGEAMQATCFLKELFFPRSVCPWIITRETHGPAHLSLKWWLNWSVLEAGCRPINCLAVLFLISSYCGDSYRWKGSLKAKHLLVETFGTSKTELILVEGKGILRFVLKIHTHLCKMLRQGWLQQVFACIEWSWETWGTESSIPFICKSQISPLSNKIHGVI